MTSWGTKLLISRGYRVRIWKTTPRGVWYWQVFRGLIPGPEGIALFRSLALWSARRSARYLASSSTQLPDEWVEL
jgi:hypothetical protein